ncbi:MAG: hypothetical protein LAO77_24870 [Acidobacteriia bacterium]|nr:hypothetical protein [Terriglobia bacterium]
MRRVSPLQWLIAAVALYRLSLLGRGAQAFADEQWHFQSILFLQALGHGHLTDALSHVAFSYSRPGLPIVLSLAGGLQVIPFVFGVAASNPVSLLIPTACNVAISLINVVLVYRIGLLVLDDDALASITVATVYSLLANSNIYVRHTLPYDWALCLLLAAIWLMLSRAKTVAVACGAGGLLALVFAVYPGYYPAVGVAGLVLVGDRAERDRAPRWQLAAGFVAGFAAVILALDALCRVGGLSYFAHIRQMVGGQTQGSFEEGWSFLPAYLITVERGGGLVLLMGAAAFVARALFDLARGMRLRRVHWLVAAATVAWAWQAFASASLHSSVLYGRLIHPWFPFLAWALGDAIVWARRRPARAALCAAAMAATVVSWAIFANQYYRVAYPADVLYALGIDTARLPAGAMRCELQSIATYASPPPLNRSTGYPYSNGTDYVLDNFCQGFPGRTENLELKREHLELAYQGPHFMGFPAYGFEGLGPEDRMLMRERAYTVRVYRTR